MQHAPTSTSCFKLPLLFVAVLTSIFSISHGEDPIVNFDNWPSVVLGASVGSPNPRDVVITADLTFPYIEGVKKWGEAKLVGNGMIEIALDLEGNFGQLPAVEEVRHTYVINQDPNTAYIALYDPTVTRQHLDLADGDYTVVFKINERILAKTEFRLREDDGDVPARFGYFIQYGSGVPIAGIVGTLTFTLPPGYELDDESLGNDDLDIKGYIGDMVEVLPVTYTSYVVMESFPEQIRISYSIQVPEVLHDGPRPAFYTVKVNPDSITFNNGENAVRNGVVGKIAVPWGNPNVGIVKVSAEAPDLLEAQEGPQSIVVSYSHGLPMESPIDTATIGDDDILVYGFKDRALHYARFVEFFPTFAPGTVIARYEINGSSGEGWSSADNGAYSIHLATGGVTDSKGNSLPARLIGEFAVKIRTSEEPPPVAPSGPIVIAEAKPLMATPTAPERAIIPYTFRVLAIDMNGVNMESLETMEISAYRHNNRPWDTISKDNTENLSAPIIATIRNVTPLIPEGWYEGRIDTVVQADCELIAPDGVWDSNDNGHYLLKLKGGQVANMLGQTHSGGVIGYFSVLIYGPIADAEILEDGWCLSPTLGFFSEKTFPWFAHPDHGWWYAASGMNNDASVQTMTGDWFYDLAMENWLYHEADWYPFLYSAEFNSWLYYFEGSRAPRYFYQFGEEKMLEVGE